MVRFKNRRANSRQSHRIKGVAVILALPLCAGCHAEIRCCISDSLSCRYLVCEILWKDGKVDDSISAQHAWRA